MRLFGDGKHGQAEQIQTFRGPACRTTFTARRHTPLYRLKTPSRQVALVLSALAEGLDLSAASRVFGYRQATITTWLTRAGEHAQTLHEHCFRNLHLPHLQLDELRTRLRCTTQVLWLWLAIDPCTKMLLVLSLGPRTQYIAHLLIHSGRSDPGRLSVSRFSPVMAYICTFTRLAAHFGDWLQVRRRGRYVQKTAGGSGSDLRPGEKMLPTAQAGAGHTRDAAGDWGRSQKRLAALRLLWTLEHGLY